MAAIPKDPVMLMSFLNTQLRDNYSSFEDLCGAYDLDAEEMKKKTVRDRLPLRCGQKPVCIRYKNRCKMLY